MKFTWIEIVIIVFAVGAILAMLIDVAMSKT